VKNGQYKEYIEIPFLLNSLAYLFAISKLMQMYMATKMMPPYRTPLSTRSETCDAKSKEWAKLSEPQLKMYFQSTETS
jgi:hypothetical protein